jgi:hypothetical protein
MTAVILIIQQQWTSTTSMKAPKSLISAEKWAGVHGKRLSLNFENVYYYAPTATEFAIVIRGGQCQVIDKTQLRELISTVLRDCNLYSADAVELLMLTAAVESKLGTYLTQIKGPARGIFQMEPATEKDLWNNYLRYKPHIVSDISKYHIQHPDELRWNLAYAILMARIHYLRVPEPIPSGTDKLAAYWKKWYNTHLGKGTTEKAIQAYKEMC